MNKSKSLLLILICLSLSACLIACTGGGDKKCQNHFDTNGDGLCEECGKEAEPKDDGGNGSEDNGGSGENEAASLELIKDGKATFQIVKENGLAANVLYQINTIKTSLKKLGIDIEVVDDKESTVKDVEILIGDITTRGEKYNYNRHKLGLEGSAIQIVGTKLIVAGGSEDKMLDVIEELKEDILGIKKNTEELTDVTVGKESLYEKIQDNYEYDSVTIGGKDAKGFTICVNYSDRDAYATAQYIQNFFYEWTGYWFSFEKLEEGSDIKPDTITVKVNENSGKGNGYKAYASGTALVIETEFANKIESATTLMLDAHFLAQDGEMKVASDFNYEKDVRSLYYSDYCKENDIALDTTGRTNAYAAMKATHDYANEYGHTVCAKAGEKYLITETGAVPIDIKTNVNWTNAEIIIDDRNLPVEWKEISPGNYNWVPSADAKTHVFTISSDIQRYTLGGDSDIVKAINTAGGINKTTTENNTTFFGFKPSDLNSDWKNAMIIPYNGDHKVYIRYGANANSGSNQCELIILDENGNIDKDTPFLLDYEKVTWVVALCVDDEPITIKGGTLTTRANKAPCSYSAGFVRNILISRSNTTISGVKHVITDEGDTGSCYEGFFKPQHANNVTLENCTLQAHRMYFDEKRDNTSPTGGSGAVLGYGTQMGSYDLSGSLSNDIYYKNCIQSNFYDKDGNQTSRWYDENGEGAKNNKGDNATVWGVMGSSYCKNITYDGCTINRLDAHAGVVNASIINGSKLSSIRLIGGGTALIENSTVYGSTIISLREDYGSTWRGDVIIKDTTFISNDTKPALITGKFANHYFGYPTYMPTTVTIDGLKIEGPAQSVYVFNIYDVTDDITADTYNGEENKNPMALTEKIIIKNADADTHTYTAAPAGTQFESIPVEYGE